MDGEEGGRHNEGQKLVDDSLRLNAGPQRAAHGRDVRLGRRARIARVRDIEPARGLLSVGPSAVRVPELQAVALAVAVGVGLAELPCPTEACTRESRTEGIAAATVRVSMPDVGYRTAVHRHTVAVRYGADILRVANAPEAPRASNAETRKGINGPMLLSAAATRKKPCLENSLIQNVLS
eukprot:CAMPEP_0183437304 /NCGR_PEP_ID=MMETSP0370-20130417/72348_1 /TAXON_ID=268820 /ORGANISM="Peridinium aciculiferum, Strain PAER-2" /LENGTH=179 /DNA_ID=CAMNT_0025625053 /DNA_START=55 /DNA_END=592 /DNA_ORIENTATION=-